MGTRKHEPTRHQCARMDTTTPTAVSLRGRYAFPVLANASLGIYLTHVDTYAIYLGDTRVQFHMLTDKKTTRKALKNVESDKSVAMVCLNDDVIKDQGSVDRTLTAWLRKKWPRPATWER